MGIGGNYAYQLCRTNTYNANSKFLTASSGGYTTYVRTHLRNKIFIKQHKDAPVEFSKMDHYIRMFVNGRWHTINGFSKEDYYKLITEDD